jgi:hypothetical protein
MSGYDLSVDSVKERLPHVFSSRVVPPSPADKDKEYEVKRLVTEGGPQTFSDVMTTLPLMELQRQPNGRLRPASEVFLLSPNYHFKNYHLANFALEDPDFSIYWKNFQLRQRFAVYANKDWNDPQAFGISQLGVKDRLSQSGSDIRLEIEGVARGIGAAAGSFMEDKKDDLPFTVDANRLHVPGGFMVGRGSYLLGVYVPDRDAIQPYAVENDEIVSFTPHLIRINETPTYELETEGRDPLNFRDSKVHVHKAELFGPANALLDAHLQAAGFGRKLQFATHSKHERAMNDVHEFYKRDAMDYFNDAAQNRRLPPLGMQYAIEQGVTMTHIEQMGKSGLISIASEMTRAKNLIASTPRIRKVEFCIRKAEEGMALKLAHG